MSGSHRPKWGPARAPGLGPGPVARSQPFHDLGAPRPRAIPRTFAAVSLLQPGRDRRLVTTALVLAMVLAALEATAVGTAMPTVVSELGGVSRYSWVFSAYLLTST